jgi:hypothetical protein
MTRGNKTEAVNMVEPTCVHWWIIGDYLVGRCKKCGATKDFQKLREAEQERHKNHRGKMTE